MAGIGFIVTLLLSIIVGILVIIWIIFGSIFIVSGIAVRKSALEKGRKHHIGLITAGIIILFLPVIALITVRSVQVISINIQRSTYINCIDKWRYENVSDDDIWDDIYDEFLPTLETGDKELIKSYFAKNIQNDDVFNEELDKFFEEYPKGLFEGKNNWDYFSEPTVSYANTENMHYIVTLNETDYYFRLSACYDNDDPDKIGITKLSIRSEKSEAIRTDYDYKFIYADTVVEKDFEVIRISDMAFVYNPQGRKITYNELESIEKECTSVYELYKIIGEPDAFNEYTSHVLYEFVPDENGRRFLLIEYDYYGRIVRRMYAIDGP